MFAIVQTRRFIPWTENHDKRINIRVQNVRFETLVSTLNRYPRTLLGCKEKRQVYYNENTDEIEFDRSVLAFDAILFYYQSYGILNRPPLVEMEEFLDECNFFELDQEEIKKMKEIESYIEDDNENIQPNEDNKDGDEMLELLKESARKPNILIEQNQNCIKSCRERLWRFFEEPSSSRVAGLFAIFSFLLIAASVAIACMLTIPEIGNDRNPDPFKDTWALIELTLNSCFALEYVLRFMVTPRFIKFLLSPLNVIDLLAFLPYFVVFLMDPANISRWSFLRMIRMIRVLRLLRLSKQSKKVAAVLKMLKDSVKDIFTLVLSYFVSAVVFGSLQYYMEVGTHKTPFTSIPQSMWWAFQTIVPLGYGDIVPSSLRGKIIGGSVAAFGAITLTVPLLHLGGKFLADYADKNDLPVGRDVKLEDNITEVSKKQPSKPQLVRLR